MNKEDNATCKIIQGACEKHVYRQEVLSTIPLVFIRPQVMMIFVKVWRLAQRTKLQARVCYDFLNMLEINGTCSFLNTAALFLTATPTEFKARFKITRCPVRDRHSEARSPLPSKWQRQSSYVT
jgi:hypothetical protein